MPLRNRDKLRFLQRRDIESGGEAGAAVGFSRGFSRGHSLSRRRDCHTRDSGVDTVGRLETGVVVRIDYGTYG